MTPKMTVAKRGRKTLLLFVNEDGEMTEDPSEDDKTADDPSLPQLFHPTIPKTWKCLSMCRRKPQRPKSSHANGYLLSSHVVRSAFALANQVSSQHEYEKSGHVVRLRKALYGLKEAPRAWNITLHNQLYDRGFVRHPQEPCVYLVQAAAVERVCDEGPGRG